MFNCFLASALWNDFLSRPIPLSWIWVSMHQHEQEARKSNWSYQTRLRAAGGASMKYHHSRKNVGTYLRGGRNILAWLPETLCSMLHGHQLGWWHTWGREINTAIGLMPLVAKLTGKVAKRATWWGRALNAPFLPCRQGTMLLKAKTSLDCLPAVCWMLKF